MPRSFPPTNSETEVKICIAVSTIGKTDRFDLLLDSIQSQNSSSFVFGVCDQSTDSQVRERIHQREWAIPTFLTTSDAPGLSAGRNAVISSAPEDCTHFMFPNDTSTFGPNLIQQLSHEAINYDVVVMSYSDGQRPRYLFPQSTDSLNKENIWLAIEPGTVLSSRLIHSVNGFDEHLGTGCDTPFQAGEGSDLLLRALPFTPKAKWVPDLVIDGVPQAYSLSQKQRRNKQLMYGRGYAEVLRRHRYSSIRRTLSILAPFRHINTWIHRSAFIEALYLSVGRLQGGFPFTRSIPFPGELGWPG